MSIHWVQAIIFFLLGTFFGGTLLGKLGVGGKG